MNRTPDTLLKTVVMAVGTSAFLGLCLGFIQGENLIALIRMALAFAAAGLIFVVALYIPLKLISRRFGMLAAIGGCFVIAMAGLFLFAVLYKG